MARPDKSRRQGKSRRDDKNREFDQEVLHIARVARVVKGGRRFSFRAAVAIGNRKGKIGIGVAKGSDVSSAIGKAVNAAKKDMITFPIVNSTIPHEIYTKYESAKIILKPARVGRGIVAGGSLRILAELGGIKNISGKSLGSNNKINTAKAMIKALTQMKSVKR